jgi:hypothetical protein
MADVFSYNPSKTQFLDLSKRNPRTVFSSVSAIVLPLISPGILPYRSILCALVCVCLGRHTTTPNISKFDTVLYPTNERSSIHTLKHAQITGGVSKFWSDPAALDCGILSLSPTNQRSRNSNRLEQHSINHATVSLPPVIKSLFLLFSF